MQKVKDGSKFFDIPPTEWGSISSPSEFVLGSTNTAHSRSDTMPVPGLGRKGMTNSALISWTLNLQEWSPITLVKRLVGAIKRARNHAELSLSAILTKASGAWVKLPWKLSDQISHQLNSIEISVNSVWSTKVTLDQSPSPKDCVIQWRFEATS